MTSAALARIGRRHPVRLALDELLTRCFYSASGYVFESDPYVVPEDDALLQALASVREEDRRHAHVLGALVQGLGGVPAPGVFPWWNLDLNYLSVPCLGRFVVGSLEHETGLYSRLISQWPAEDAGGRAALESILSDKKGHIADLRPVVLAATTREEAETKAKIQAIKNARNARLAKEKAAKEAARKAQAAAKAAPAAGKPAGAALVKPAAALLDPSEPGISSKEKGRRVVLKLRAAQGGGAAAPAPSAAASPAAAPGAAAPAPAALDASSLLDPNEPGISPKERAKRQIARQRAAQGAAGAPAGAAPAAAPASDAGAAAAPAPAAAAPALAEDLGDPDEPGISPKEKARRTVARMRAKKG